MPGVPTSRACDACMKQKKKCDQAIPACGRCSRLRIPCVGAGTQRYKFLRIDGRREEGVTSLVILNAASPLRPLTNGTTRLSTELLQQLSVDNVRYDLCYAYGPHLLEVPKRLGASKVLDASVTALVLTVRDISNGRRSHERFVSYGRSLVALRTALQDPEEATSSLTLCAIFVIWICQGWIGGDQSECQGHGAGLMRLLALSTLRHSNGAFERQLLPVLIIPIIFEAAFDPSLKVETWMQEVVLGKGTRGITVLTCFSHLQDFMRFDPQSLPKITLHYEAMRKQSMQAHRDLYSKQRTPAPVLRDIAPGCASLAMSSGIALVLNEIIQLYKPDRRDLIYEALELYQSILDVSSQAPKLLPLSANWLPLSLELAWASTTDHARRNTLEQTWDRYWKEASGASFGVSKRFLASFDKLRAEAFANLHSVLVK